MTAAVMEMTDQLALQSFYPGEESRYDCAGGPEVHESRRQIYEALEFGWSKASTNRRPTFSLGN